MHPSLFSLLILAIFALMSRNIILVMVLLLAFLTEAKGQYGHYYQHELFYLADAETETDYDIAMGHTGPVRARHTNKHFMRKSVYGFHPGWSGTAWESYDYGLLPTISYYGYIVNPANGSYKSVYFWKTTNLIDSAHAKGSSVELAVATGSAAANRQLLGNPKSVTNLVDSLVHLLQLRDGDGLCLDFEGLPKNRRDQFTGFVHQLRDSLKKHLPRAGITLCLPASDEEQAYNIDSLRPLVNQFVIKPYDQKAKLVPGPIAPLRSGGEWKNRSVDASISGWMKVGIPRDQMVLSVPNYSWKWEIQPSTAAYTKTVGGPRLLTFSDLKRNYNHPHEVDSLAMEKSYTFAGGAGLYQIFASDAMSIRARYDFAYDRNLGGVAIWALGYDQGFDALWRTLKTSFSQSVKDEVGDLAVEKKSELLLGPDNGETRERNRNNWIPMLIGCLFLIVLLMVLKRVM